MKLTTLALATTLVLATGNAFAQQVDTTDNPTRAQVEAQAIRAQDAGQIPVGDDPGYPNLPVVASTANRAAVHQAAVRADATHALQGEIGADVAANAVPAGSADHLTRAEVKQQTLVAAKDHELPAVGDDPNYPDDDTAQNFQFNPADHPHLVKFDQWVKNGVARI